MAFDAGQSLGNAKERRGQKLIQRGAGLERGLRQAERCRMGVSTPACGSHFPCPSDPLSSSEDLKEQQRRFERAAAKI